MNHLPFRTGKTWLSDDQLVLLDVLFRGGTWSQLLRRDNFFNQWNFGYTHGLEDDALECNLRWLCEHGILETEQFEDRTCFLMTPAGGDLWSQERCPIWDRYCTDRYTTTAQGRTMMTVLAVSPKVRDEFLDLWPPYPARRRKATIMDQPLIGWHSFARLYVGIATYEEPIQFTAAEFPAWAERKQRHWAMLERERSWWRLVTELQRFIPEPRQEDLAVDRSDVSDVADE